MRYYKHILFASLIVIGACQKKEIVEPNINFPQQATVSTCQIDVNLLGTWISDIELANFAKTFTDSNTIDSLFVGYQVHSYCIKGDTIDYFVCNVNNNGDTLNYTEEADWIYRISNDSLIMYRIDTSLFSVKERFYIKE